MGRFIFRDDPGVIIRCEIPAGAHWFDASVAAAALLCPVFTSIPAFAPVLRDALLLLGSASILKLDVDGTRVLFPHPEANALSGFFLPEPTTAEQVAELLPNILVEVEVDEGVVDMGALGKEDGEHEAPGGHVLVSFVEN